MNTRVKFVKTKRRGQPLVECKVCGLRKKPIGRSAPLEMANSLCDYECEGYKQDPQPQFLWPGEEVES